MSVRINYILWRGKKVIVFTLLGPEVLLRCHVTQVGATLQQMCMSVCVCVCT